MKTVYILYGAPCSGKSYFSNLISRHDDQVKIVSRDSIRDMLNDHSQNKHTEDLVSKIEKNMIMEIIDNSDFDLILDNTHYRLQYIRQALDLLQKCKKDLKVKLVDFSDCDFELIEKRMSTRERKVDLSVVKKIYQSCKTNAKEARNLVSEFKKEKTETILVTNVRQDLPRAILVDIDGTLAHKHDRNAYDYKHVDKDECDMIIAELVNQLYRLHYTIIIVSGREDSCQDLTISWLKKHMIDYHHLYMRKSKDMRKDRVVKKEIYDREIKDKYSVLFVLDDRNQVVEMWREIGLKCLQVQEGNF
jgi:predicted kinase